MAKVVSGPREDDCWLWVGAIADDGYRRFSLRREGRERMVRPQRLLFEHVTGRELTRDVELLHTCDVPICVRVTADADTHLLADDHGANMRDRERKGRAGRHQVGMRGLSRRQLATRSRTLRDLVLTMGWNREAIAAVIAGAGADQPTLFDWPA
ncbi:hypothetical protein [Microbacterium sp. BLY]|uniref:hypothetical protein n=1 Tax=Microbacterium sp. BLY TaxID=2823280 RepID=UPI001B342AC7|nr:hypothetical protein [Microbacterium sp. BLY]MBP3977013.1 hypothetical protein [Microbacterium sp. BLY]